MSELEEKLNTVLNNPQLMQQILSLAQSMGNAPAEDPKPQAAQKTAALPAIDPKLLQSISSLAQENSIDQNQHALLCALSPYLSQNRVNKLDRAMRAARIARTASGLLNAGLLQK